MFNDFKILNFSTTKKKIRKLLDIFERLRLPDLEDRLLKISPRLEQLNHKIESYTRNLPTVPVIPPVVPPADLPDLAITGLKPTIYSNYVNFEITITNIGEEVSPATTLNQIIPELLDNNVPVPALEPEEIFITNIQYSFDPAGDVKPQTFLADVNPTRSFPEITYENNSNSVVSNIKGEYTPPPGKGYLIVHLHNPEGKEIGSINPLFPLTVSHGVKPVSLATHGIPTAYNPGNYNVVATFNGMTLTQNIDIVLGETIEIVFTFERTERELDFSASADEEKIDNLAFILNGTQFSDAYPPYNILLDTIPPWHIWQRLTGASMQFYPYPWYSNVPTVIFTGVHSLKSVYSINANSGNIYIKASLNGSLPNITWPPPGEGDPSGGGVQIWFQQESWVSVRSTPRPYTPPSPLPFIPFNVSSQSGFDFWYVQQITNTNYFSAQIKDIDGNNYSFCSSASGYNFVGVYADKDYVGLNFLLPVPPLVSIGVNELFIVDEENGHIISAESEDTKIGSTFMKMSSVPYDMEGTAV